MAQKMLELLGSVYVCDQIHFSVMNIKTHDRPKYLTNTSDLP